MFLVQTDDGLLCEDRRGSGTYERCRREISETTLSGELRCPDCQKVRGMRTRRATLLGAGENYFDEIGSVETL